MYKRTATFAAIIVLLICTSSLYAWTGESPFGSISRETILMRASEMVEFSWSPKNSIVNHATDEKYCSFTAGITQRGEAYCQEYHQENWPEFLGLVNNTAFGNAYYGNDCSGFVSMSWKLPTRYITADFEYDATHEGGYVTSLGSVGGAQSVGLLPGDALVWRDAATNKGHIILFEKDLLDSRGKKIGVVALEQTPCRAIRGSEWTWERLAIYRPIRRNKIDEGNYEYVTQWGAYGSANKQFINPNGIATDTSGYIYVVDNGNHRVQKFDSTGQYVTQWGDINRFGNINGIFVDSGGYAYVADAAYHRVQKFSSTGSYMGDWFTYNWNPWGITKDYSGNLYVADDQWNDIYKFTDNGTLALWYDLLYSVPRGIAADIYGNVYVTDIWNSRVLKFNSSGNITVNWGSGGFALGEPFGITADPSGNVYVADTDNNRIQKFESDGNYMTSWGSYGPGNSQLNGPRGVAVDRQLNVFVADTSNHRIQKFTPVSKYPSRPTSLSATQISSTQIRLNWADNSNNETGFNVKRKTGVRGEYSVIAKNLAANTTTFTDTIAGPGNYYYAVYAVNGAGDSAYSNEATVMVKSPMTVDIKVSVSDGPASDGPVSAIDATGDLSVTFNTGGLSGYADAWVAANIHGTDTWYVLTPSGQWVNDSTPTYYQGVLSSQSGTVYSDGAASKGNVYDIFFALDLTNNGIMDDLIYDVVTIDNVTGIAATALEPLKFFDVPTTYWAYSQIMNMANRNDMTGCGGGFFCTGNKMTRAMAAEYIIKSMNQQPSAVAYNAYFDDLYPDYVPVAGYINRMKELGITSGCGYRAYCPGSQMTRAEMAVFIIVAKIIAHGERTSTAVYNAYFDDIANDWFAPYINRMKELGITGGCGYRAYCPYNTVPKDQMAVFLTTAFPY